jgi:stage II sporulation protein D
MSFLLAERNMRNRHFIIVSLVLALSLTLGCHKESNPAVPAAPEGDVIRIVKRDEMLKIGLLSFTPQKHLYISITRGTLNCYIGESLEPFADGISGNVLKFTGGDESIEYTPPGTEESRDLSNTIVRIEPGEGVENGFVEVGASKYVLRPYRGVVYLKLEGKNVLAINKVPLEEYLQGVVPAEMDPTWPEEALKAQAVVSRTFVLFHMPRYEERGFNLADDDRSQEYGGYAVETEATTNAVIDTTGEVLTFNGKLAAVVFHAESPTQTAGNLDVWPNSGDVPYLAGVSDVMGVVDYSEGGKYREWSSWASFDQLRNAFNEDGETYVGDYLSAISILDLSDNGRIRSLDILGEKNPVVDAITLSQVLNRHLSPDFLPSNKFKITIDGEGYRFTGSGKGHGVGMSQWGAFQRASQTQTYVFILQQYYPGCAIGAIPLEGIEAVHNIHIDTLL